MGRRGVQEVASQCVQKAAYAAKEIGKLSGFSLPFSGPRFNEFVVRGPSSAAPLLSRLAEEKGIEGGLALSRFLPGRANDFLVCVTETNTREEIDALVTGLSAVAKHA
jgi:glycine dehydrogenase subunit 1